MTVVAEHGLQLPRIAHIPAYGSSAGSEAVDLARQAGLVLDPWQQHVLEVGLGEQRDGTWSSFEVGVIVPRQNGKGAILEARELAGLFLFGEELILHSAHEFKTAAEAFRRILSLVEGTPGLSRRVRKVRTSHGDEGIELKTGQRLRFVARSTGSGRGFSGDCVILDEAYNLSNDAMAALLPTLSARPNPQIWYTSSAGMQTSVQLGRVRRRGVAKSSPRLAFFEWSIPEETDPAEYGRPDLWAMANPGLGIRILEAFVEGERQALDAESFGRERLGVGDYPLEDGDRWAVIRQETWEALADADITPADRVGRPAFCADTTPDRSMSAIAVAFRRPDGGVQLEIVEHRAGTGWVAPRLVELITQYDPCAVVVDKAGSAASVVDELEAEEIEVVQPSGYEVTEAYGQIYEALTETTGTHHCDQPELNAAVAGAGMRKIGDRTAWDRRAGTDICPLVAVTGADWGLRKFGSEGDALDNIW